VNPLKRYYATGEINFEVKNKDAKIEEISKIFADAEIDYLDGITVSYPDWWCNVRKSNTEPVLRLNLEAKTKELMEKTRNKIISILKA
ncbi:MAG: phosphomannomutase/phosphoglucomutase, partial [Planctomycetota bacterium]